jgi:hypothetical protein
MQNEKAWVTCRRETNGTSVCMSLLLCTIKKASYANVVKFYNQSSKNMEWNIQNENMEEQYIFKILFLLLVLQF